MGIALPDYTPVEIVFRGPQPDLDFVELQQVPTRGLPMVMDSPAAPPCAACGYQRVVWPHWPDGELIVSEASLPKNLDIAVHELRAHTEHE